MATNFQKISSGIQLSLQASAPSSPANGMIYYDSSLNQFQKYENGSWSAFSAGTVASGTARRLALYPSSSASISDTDTENSQSVNVAIVAQPTRTAGIVYQITNPGDAVTTADFVLTAGAQTIGGAKTFSNDAIFQGNLTVNGTTTFVNSTQTQIADPLITLNKGGATASAAGAGIEFEENSAITGYFKTSAARTGFDLKSPATAGIATLITASGSQTYTLPNKSGTFMLQVIDDTAPQLGGALDVNGNAIVSASNGNIIIAPQGTGRIRRAKAGALTRYVDQDYQDALALTAGTTAVLAALTFDTTVYKAEIIEYMIVDGTTNARRVGRLMVVADGASGSASTNVSITDLSNETADPGVVFSAAMSSNNCQISYTTTANAKAMNADIKRFLG